MKLINLLKLLVFFAHVVDILDQLQRSVFEVGISYNGRTCGEGKKIRFKDAIIAVLLNI